MLGFSVITLMLVFFLCSLSNLDSLGGERRRLRHNRHWVDETFPHTNASLYENGVSPAKRNIRKQPFWDAIEWRSAADFSPNTNAFKEIKPTDIHQGSLGDCWLLCSISALAEYPERIKKLFDFSQVKEGKYGVRLWYDETARAERHHFRSGRRNGWATQKVFYVDDYFPYTPDGRPAYSRMKKGELWVALIEKAFAKCYGSYEELCGGQSADALFQMTGYKCETIDWASGYNANHYQKRLDARQIWSKLLCFDKQKWVMTCTNSKDVHGLVGDH